MHPLGPALRRACATLALVAVTAATGLAATPAVLPRALAAEPVPIAVDVPTDAPLTAGCSDGAAGTTLREALCQAAAVPDAVVTVPAGTRTTLVAGPLTYAPGAPATLLVTSPGTFTVDGDGRRVLDLDPGLVGGVDVTLEGVTLTGGVPDATDSATAPGGGAVLAGTGDPGSPDALTLRRCTVTGNANGPGGAWAPGGAVQMNGGDLTVEDCTFSQNSATGAPGGAVAVVGGSAADRVRVVRSTFDQNVVTGDAGSGILTGGALHVVGATLTVEDSVLTGNRVTTVAPSTARGAAVHATGTTTVVGTRVEANVATGAGAPTDGGALWLTAGSVTDSVLVGNTDTLTGGARPAAVVGPVSATRSWWGAAATAPAAQIGAIGTTAVDPRAVPQVAAEPQQPRTGGAVTATAGVVLSDGGAAAARLLARLSGTAVVWDLGGGVADGAPTTDTTLRADGTATARFVRSATATGSVQATVGGVATNRVDLAQPVPPTVGRPADVDVAEGGAATFTATASGVPAPTLQWQRAAPGTSVWADVPGATSGSLTLTAARADDGARYRLVATNTEGVTLGAAASLLVRWGPEITAGPQDVALPAGATARFTVAVAGTPAPTVQWQQLTGPGTWTDLPGAVGATYDRVLTPQDDGVQLRARATGATGTVDSAAATVTIRTLPVITTDPVDARALEGAAVGFDVVASGVPTPTIRWQQAAAGTDAWTDLPGEVAPRLTVTADRALTGTRYRAVAENALGSATSAPATLVVDWAPQITRDPAATTVLDGATARFEAAADGSAPLAWQWEVRTRGGAWTPVPGAVGPVYERTVTLADDDAEVRVTVTNPVGSRTSATAVLTVHRAPAFTTDPADTVADAGTDAVLTAIADGNPAPTLRWQSRVPDGAWTDLAGATTGTLTVAATAVLDGTQYRALASNAAAADVPSAVATLRVLTAPTVTDPADVIAAAGTDARFVVRTTGRPAPVVTWQTSPDGLAWTDVPGVAGPELLLPATAATDGVRVRAVATSTLVGGPASATSAAAVLTVLPLPEVVRVPDGVTPDGVLTTRVGDPLRLSWVVDGELATATGQASRDGGRTWGALPDGARVAQEPATPGTFRVAALLAATPASGPTRYTLTYTPTAADDGLQLRLSITNPAGTTTTEPVILRLAGATAVPQPGRPAATGPTAPGGTPGAGGGRDRLAVTGDDAAVLAVTALALALGGAGLLTARRRRGRA